MKSSTWSGLVGQLAWAITLATGFGTLWFVLVAWLIGSNRRVPAAGRRHWPEREWLADPVRWDCPDQPYQVGKTFGQIRRDDSYRDLEGRYAEGAGA